jgi:hypothetical protein
VCLRKEAGAQGQGAGGRGEEQYVNQSEAVSVAKLTHGVCAGRGRVHPRCTFLLHRAPFCYISLEIGLCQIVHSLPDEAEIRHALAVRA